MASRPPGKSWAVVADGVDAQALSGSFPRRSATRTCQTRRRDDPRAESLFRPGTGPASTSRRSTEWPSSPVRRLSRLSRAASPPTRHTPGHPQECGVGRRLHVCLFSAPLSADRPAPGGLQCPRRRWRPRHATDPGPGHGRVRARLSGLGASGMTRRRLSDAMVPIRGKVILEAHDAPVGSSSVGVPQRIHEPRRDRAFEGARRRGRERRPHPHRPRRRRRDDHDGRGDGRLDRRDARHELVPPGHGFAGIDRGTIREHLGLPPDAHRPLRRPSGIVGRVLDAPQLPGSRRSRRLAPRSTPTSSS